jgi:FlaA1/EpsC-like NDP-sugar epimerase
MMSISKAVELVLKTVEFAKGGEIFILKMPALRIGDLADVMIEELAPKYGHKPNEIEIKIVGRRAGEKLYEELMTEDEAENAYEDEEIILILPEITGIKNRLSYNLPENFKKAQKRIYFSNGITLLNKEEIRSLLKEFHSITI